ncbi:3-hydroxyacyl-CoA dehydrogenase [Conexibacter sp. CPCC 206217]|uniref:3-hydroxyacyl-CoA dehydrogenase n=1 Tax=Conexibacter sp. CPCC 206217 TaxID=3064574 RepID=UPI00271D3823|nr:3-hydroxyacyl-CoA dehydrogenase [Conexibacter sp. CPCC 206217]MDO8209031.1 3-hydroxyacyl-CoA dehydrogenase [Conexibacter sp. CPCC 206217]
MIAVVGSGSIGVAWAIVFARAGRSVALHDTDAGRLDAARGELRARLDELAAAGLLDAPPAAVAQRVATHTDLATALDGAIHVQECAPERVELKRELFAQLDALAAPHVSLASSSSALTASSFAGELPGRERCLVVHPANPPFLLPVVELVPAPFTAAAVVDGVEALLRDAGMSPVRVAHEPEGFVFNRLQGALLREAYCLVRDGVASVEDVDRVVREGLGRRWAIIGPFETVDLNTRGGIASHAEKMGPAYARMGAERGQDDPWTPELVATVAQQRRALLPLEQWDERVAWRDRELIAAERARRAAEPSETR